MKRLFPIFLAATLASFAAQAQEASRSAAEIQTLIDRADAGAIIEVPAGFYSGTLTLKDNITVVGAGDGATVLDGKGEDRVVTFGKESALIGFTVQNGRILASSKGNFIGLFECTLKNYTAAGLLFEGGSGVIANNVISGNDRRQIGIICHGANPLVVNNLIEENRIGFQWRLNLIPSLVHNLFRNNDVAINGSPDGQIILEENLFDGNGQIGHRGELPESNIVGPVAPEDFVMQRGQPIEAYHRLMDSTYEGAVKDHPIVVYDLHDQPGTFDVITLFPWASFEVAASVIETVIHGFEAYDWVADRQLNAEFVRASDNRPAVKVHNPDILEKMRERFVLENIYECASSYYTDENGNRIFKRMTNLGQIEIVIPSGFRFVSSKPAAILHDGGDRAWLSIQDIGRTDIEVVLEPVAVP